MFRRLIVKYTVNIDKSINRCEDCYYCKCESPAYAPDYYYYCRHPDCPDSYDVYNDGNPVDITGRSIEYPESEIAEWCPLEVISNDSTDNV